MVCKTDICWPGSSFKAFRITVLDEIEMLSPLSASSPRLRPRGGLTLPFPLKTVLYKSKGIKTYTNSAVKGMTIILVTTATKGEMTTVRMVDVHRKVLKIQGPNFCEMADSLVRRKRRTR